MRVSYQGWGRRGGAVLSSGGRGVLALELRGGRRPSTCVRHVRVRPPVLGPELGTGDGVSEICIGGTLQALVAACDFLGTVVFCVHFGVAVFPSESVTALCVGKADFPPEELTLAHGCGVVVFSAKVCLSEVRCGILVPPAEGVALCVGVADVPTKGFALALGFRTMVWGLGAIGLAR